MGFTFDSEKPRAQAEAAGVFLAYDSLPVFQFDCQCFNTSTKVATDVPIVIWESSNQHAAAWEIPAAIVI
jgi:hypothetical protein